MAKRKSRSLRTVGQGRGKGTTFSVFDVPGNEHLREDARLYLALCIIGAVELNMRAYTQSLEEDFGVKRTDSAVTVWMRNKDPVCKELWAHLKLNGPVTKQVSAWLVKARIEQKSWSKEED